MTYAPDRRQALDDLLDSDLYARKLVTIAGVGQVEQWTAPGGAFVVEFPVPGDTACSVVDHTGRQLARTADADLQWLEDVLP